MPPPRALAGHLSCPPLLALYNYFQMEHGVVVTKYGKKGAAAQKILFLDGSSKCVAWRDLDSRSPGHRRTPSLTNLMKGQRESLALAHLVEVSFGAVGGRVG